MSVSRLVLNALGFQAVWWAWALGVPEGEWLFPTVVSLVFLFAHLRLSVQRRADVLSVLACVLVGFAFDTALIQTQLVEFHMPNPAPLANLQPGWMLLLWACLGCTFHTSLAWLRRLPVLTYPLCAVFGWLAYDAAALLGALTRQPGWPSLLALLLFWAVFIPGVQRATAPAEA
jgi:hypothetical protein